jgi:NADH pyrophosphatase NudC (nudix superfamily)
MSDEEFDEIHQPVAAQVKEKFGGLRFYVDNADDYTRGVIAMAESMSYKTCEVCGSPGKQTGKGWIKTVCESCNKTQEV